MVAHQSHIFETPEVLEHILLQCDMRTLLISAQRVNQFWHSIINNSPAIQKALFYRLDDTGLRDDETLPALRSPLLSELCSSLFAEAPEFHIGANNSAKTSMAQWRAGEIVPSWRRMLVQQRPPVRTIGVWCVDGDWEGTLWVTAKLFSVFAPPRDSSSGSQMPDKEDGLRMGDYFDLATYRSRAKPDRTLVFWPKVEDHFRPGKDPSSSLSNSLFLTDVKEPRHSDNPALDEVQFQKERIAREADMIFATPLNIYMNLAGKRSTNGAPNRDNAMMKFLEPDEIGLVMGAHCIFRETYSWSTMLKNGFDSQWWMQEDDDWEGCLMFD